ncbi:hypothetical protein AV530_015588 [Patagioenas fasciata monilis]|uniref:Uncharacterized protein n=1 Tax=Patagioenas fasciata monilis TaxID=372326 RepID=A0A1V4KI25_PATFA|nr:hypothetical protein AV530_015588 [Patagioenas fasciata monilis]
MKKMLPKGPGPHLRSAAEPPPRGGRPRRGNPRTGGVGARLFAAASLPTLGERTTAEPQSGCDGNSRRIK